MTDPTYETESYHTPESLTKLNADRIEALLAERDALKAENQRLREALNKIAVSASVSYAKPKKMYKGWRKIAVERIDIARAALKGDNHD